MIRGNDLRMHIYAKITVQVLVNRSCQHELVLEMYDCVPALDYRAAQKSHKLADRGTSRFFARLGVNRSPVQSIDEQPLLLISANFQRFDTFKSSPANTI